MKRGPPAASVAGAIAEAQRAAAAAPSAQGSSAGRAVSVHYRYYVALTGFAAQMPLASVDALRQDPNVNFIEADQMVTIDNTQFFAPWGLDRIDQASLPLDHSYTFNYTGAGVTAYIIDTGIRTSHKDFGGRASVGYDAMFWNGQDCNGHGTHVAGIVGGTTFGVAKGVRLVAVGVFDCWGNAPISAVIGDVCWVAAQTARPAVANMSLSGGGGLGPALNVAVIGAISKGVTVVVAAGNDSADACSYSPAEVGLAITVGATDISDTRASFSNFGACLDLFAPGVRITSDWDTSDTATNTISGTSMATPHVIGVAALYLQHHPTASPATVRDALVNAATSNKVINPGNGSPNKLLYSWVP